MTPITLTLALSMAISAAAAPAPRALTTAGLAPVRMGMTVAATQKALRSRLALDDPDPTAACATAMRTDGADPQVSYMFHHGKLVRIDVGEPEKPVPHELLVPTAAGIKVGATEADVMKAYGKRAKVAPHPYDAEHGHYLDVYSASGKLGYVFETHDGKVIAFRAGTRLAIDLIEGCN